MIDTGADVTVVHKHVAEDLGIPPLRLHPLVGISGEPQMRPVYLLSVVLGLSDGISREGSMTMDAQMIGIDGDRDAECSGVLGRDFLSVCRFYYDGPRGAFVIDCGEFDKRDSISEAIRPAGLGRS
ncbi:MAG: aspartyl protease family protein [Proteobacteria bacterium]|nr:aspartyl protease family protein [Pseudomonadota bacterium]